MMKEEHFLDFLPYRASFYDKDLKLVYSNKQSDGSFFPEPEPKKLPDWILQDLQVQESKSLHFQLPTESFQDMIIQSYQALYDDKGEFQGVYHYIQNIKPLLSSYLNETGQAIVGWSDVTSGASIKNDLFDEI